MGNVTGSHSQPEKCVECAGHPSALKTLPMITANGIVACHLHSVTSQSDRKKNVVLDFWIRMAVIFQCTYCDAQRLPGLTDLRYLSN